MFSLQDDPYGDSGVEDKHICVIELGDNLTVDSLLKDDLSELSSCLVDGDLASKMDGLFTNSLLLEDNLFGEPSFPEDDLNGDSALEHDSSLLVYLLQSLGDDLPCDVAHPMNFLANDSSFLVDNPETVSIFLENEASVSSFFKDNPVCDSFFLDDNLGGDLSVLEDDSNGDPFLLHDKLAVGSVVLGKFFMVKCELPEVIWVPDLEGNSSILAKPGDVLSSSGKTSTGSPSLAIVPVSVELSILRVFPLSCKM